MVLQAQAPYRLEEDLSQNSRCWVIKPQGTRLRLSAPKAEQRKTAMGNQAGGQKLCHMGMDGVNAARSGQG